MKIFVTGSNGFVGSYVVAQLLKDGYEVFASSKTGDISSFNSNSNYRFIQADFADPFAIHDAFEFVRPDVVVHCGAMSKPNDCELHQADAYDANVFGTVQLLLNAAEYQAFFVYLSTDFIFDGKKGIYSEEDMAAPLSYYGKTKKEAEEAVMEYQHGWTIVRTCFVYGKPIHGRDSFITMIAKKLKNAEPFNVVNDQERTPTFAPDLATGIATIIKKRATGIYNLAGEGIYTPYTMAIATAQHLGITNHRLAPVNRDTFIEMAERPLNSGLNSTKAIQDLDYHSVSFEEGLRETLDT